MSTYGGAEDDIVLENVVESDFSLLELTQAVRDQLLKDARRKGNLFGPTAAQKKTPLASKPQTPGTQRVF